MLCHVKIHESKNCSNKPFLISRLIASLITNILVQMNSNALLEKCKNTQKYIDDEYIEKSLLCLLSFKSIWIHLNISSRECYEAKDLIGSLFVHFQTRSALFDFFQH